MLCLASLHWDRDGLPCPRIVLLGLSLLDAVSYRAAGSMYASIDRVCYLVSFLNVSVGLPNRGHRNTAFVKHGAHSRSGHGRLQCTMQRMPMTSCDDGDSKGSCKGNNTNAMHFLTLGKLALSKQQKMRPHGYLTLHCLPINQCYASSTLTLKELCLFCT